MKSDLALGKLSLYKDIGDGKFIVLNFGVYKEVLRVYVKESKAAGDKGKNLINMPMMFINARLFIDEFKKLNNEKEGYSFMMETYGPKWTQDGKRIEGEKNLVGKIGFARAKDKEGNLVNLLYVVTNQNVKKVFPIVPTPYLVMYRNGEKITDKEELSKLWTTAYIKSLESVLDNLPEVNNERDDNNPDNKTSYKKNNSFKKKESSSSDVDDLDYVM